MRIIAVFCVLLASSVAAYAATSPANPTTFVHGQVVLDAAAQEQWLQLVATSSSLMVVRIELNGQPVNALVDTGMPMTTVDAGWAAAHAIPWQAYGSVGNLGGGETQVGIAPVGTLRIGGMLQTGGAIQVADLARLSQVAGIAIEGVIGADFLSQQAVEIDFDSRRIRFRPSGALPPPGARMPLQLRERGARMLTVITVSKDQNGDAGKEAKRLDPVLIDTGDDSSLTITRAAWPDAAAHLRLTDIAAMAMGGTIYLTDIARLDGVQLGGQALNAVPVRFEGKPADAGDAARIGVELFTRFNVFMDVRAGVMVLSPRRTTPAPAEVTMAGTQGPWTDEGLELLHVMRGSPAQALGLKAGERICTIDGERVTAAGQNGPLSRWSRGPAGKVVKLGMCDGRNLSLTLRDFY